MANDLVGSPHWVPGARPFLLGKLGRGRFEVLVEVWVRLIGGFSNNLLKFF